MTKINMWNVSLSTRVVVDLMMAEIDKTSYRVPRSDVRVAVIIFNIIVWLTSSIIDVN